MLIYIVKIFILYILFTLLNLYQCMNEYKNNIYTRKRLYPYYDDIENQLNKIRLFTKKLMLDNEYIHCRDTIIHTKINKNSENLDNSDYDVNKSNLSFYSYYSSIYKFSNDVDDEYLYIFEQEELL